VVDALRPFGINDIQMPCTPERVWRAVHESRQADPHGIHKQEGGAA